MSRKTPEDIFDLSTIKRVQKKAPVDAGRICPDCGQPARIVANSYGVQAYCGPCGKDWPISGPRAATVQDIAAIPRGLSKQTLVEPDFSIAYEDDEED